MTESWFIELLKGVGRFFLNPVLYWAVILVILTGYKRIKQERLSFGFKVFDLFSEWRRTWPVSVIFGLIISAVTIGAGMVFSLETILLLAIVTIVLSLSLRLTMLSPVYTIGITFLLVLVMPLVLQNQSLINPELFEAVDLEGLALLSGILLAAEAFLLRRQTRRHTFPALELSRRGNWMGVHHLKKMALIPFFVLIPTGSIPEMASFWPYFSINNETYSLVLIPFLLGCDHVVRSELPEKAAANAAKWTYMLSLFVLLLALGGIYAGWLSLVAVAAGIIGRELIHYRHRVTDQVKTPYFQRHERGIQVLAVIPGTPADRLGVTVGEVITKVNGKSIDTIEAFYYALQDSGAFFKLTVVDDNGEVRFVQSALYEEDHHELGIITVDKPYHNNKSA
ncbi:PDZ domain-containing protein [Barrientosiimonas marina]|uniref:PDZ domain-containing protein n=1 Tax=Lentibacillus kimchii TaxID=1542911 RepID=A0ABW2UYZ7_9BACI